VREIERLGADLAQGAADRLIATIPSLEAQDIEVRKAAVQEFIWALRDVKTPPEEQPKVAAALVDAFGRNQLTPKGRYNVLFVLSRVPAAS